MTLFSAVSKLGPLRKQLFKALRRGGVEQALALLDHASSSAADETQATLALWKAELYSLSGERGVDVGLKALEWALGKQRSLERDPFFLSLRAELLSYLTEEQPQLAQQARQEALHALGGPAQARYHASCALTNLGDFKEALAAFLALDIAKLPSYLHWRYFSWLAGCLENAGKLEEAAEAYRQAARSAPDADQAIMLMEQAAVNLQLDQTGSAQQILDQAQLLGLQHGLSDLDWANWEYLEAQLQFAQGQLEAAQGHLEQARELDQKQLMGYTLSLLSGQVYSQMGRFDAACQQFQSAVRLASPVDRPYALHELGVAYLEMDATVEAQEVIRQALSHEDYPFLAEGYADLAEAQYRIGDLATAEVSAQYALAQGATLAASLILGAIALDYYNLEEAEEHYARVLEHAISGSQEWITAHQMLASILAQQGFTRISEIAQHAEQALAFTDPSDEWTLTLSAYLKRARDFPSGPGRILN
jgi:tetratricopeptide (TPR) repeat protein